MHLRTWILGILLFLVAITLASPQAPTEPTTPLSVHIENLKVHSAALHTRLESLLALLHKPTALSQIDEAKVWKDLSAIEEMQWQVKQDLEGIKAWLSWARDIAVVMRVDVETEEDLKKIHEWLEWVDDVTLSVKVEIQK